MCKFISNFVPYDANGRAVSLDTEYMYRCDGLRLKVMRFEYYKSDDTDYNWFILAPIDSSNEIKADRYKVSDLYLDCSSIKDVKQSINDLIDLKRKLSELMFRLTSNQDTYDILCNYVYDNLDVERGTFVGATVNRVLILIFTQFRRDLYNIVEKLENNDAK